jgi:hypothetical protein
MPDFEYVLPTGGLAPGEDGGFVYVLHVSNYETDWISGIYGNRTKAEAAQKLISDRFHSWIEVEQVQ